ncbi:polysaccharide pyruvyl transferase family protein [Microbacterium aureliae]
MPVEVYSFNPKRRPHGRLGRFRQPRPLNNFGDLLGPLIVQRLLEDRGLSLSSGRGRLLSVGSILHFAREGDVVWGSGINDKVETLSFPSIDVRSVRGPLTKARLGSHGIDAPEIFGDPAALWGLLWPRETYLTGSPLRDVTIIPNYNDMGMTSAVDRRIVSPLSPVDFVIREIANSRFVCGSSLHAIVIAESFGIPARLIESSLESDFKYADYYAGTGRDRYTPARTAKEAVAMGGEPPAQFDKNRLIAAFPFDLWDGKVGKNHA